METDKIVIKLEAEIAKLMTLRRKHRDEIRNISDDIDKLEADVRLRKVEILKIQKDKIKLKTFVTFHP